MFDGASAIEDFGDAGILRCYTNSDATWPGTEQVLLQVDIHFPFFFFCWAARTLAHPFLVGFRLVVVSIAREWILVDL